MDDIIKEVGRPYEMFWEDGNYQGCFYPVYKMYPRLPRYKLPYVDNDEKNYIKGIALVKRHFKEVKTLEKGDIIATKFRDELHVALYIGEGKILHVFKEHKLQINRLNFFRDYTIFRVK